MTWDYWICMILIALVTFAARALPLVVPERMTLRDSPGFNAILRMTGPCLLAAMAATILVPELVEAETSGNLVPFLSGLASAALAMRIRSDPGLATLAGVGGWWLAGSLL